MTSSSTSFQLSDSRLFPSPFLRNRGNGLRQCRAFGLASTKKLDSETNPCLVNSKVETLLDSVKWDEKGLAVAIVQHVDTGAILMEGIVDRDAIATTISTKKATFYNRLYYSVLTEGETSNNFIKVHEIFLDCNRDTIIYLGKPNGPTYHTGAETRCYTLVADLLGNKEEGDRLALTTLHSLESTISQRKAEASAPPNGKISWTMRLLLDEKLLCEKIREAADELCRALEENEDKSRVAAAMGDVLYNDMVLLSRKGVKLEDVFEVIRRRMSLV